MKISLQDIIWQIGPLHLELVDLDLDQCIKLQKSRAKVGRPRSKSVQKPKAKGTGKKSTAPTKRVVRPLLQLEPDAVEANQRPFGDQLLDLPPLDLEQGDNLPINPYNQPLDLPVEENQQNQVEEPNQVPNLPPEPEEPDQIGQLNLPPNQPNQPLTQFIIYPHQWQTHIN